MAFGPSPLGRSGRGRRAPMAEINVTPLVDVMLVLLIIFMVTAPLLVTGVPIDLPDSRAKALKSDDTPIQISTSSSRPISPSRTSSSPPRSSPDATRRG